MEISLFTAKPFMSYPKSNFLYQPRKLVSVSCKVADTKHKNFYKLLSLSSNNAKIDEIKRAYRAMALKFHPDVCHNSKKEESEKIFVQLNEAYKVLSNPISREEYNYGLRLGDSMPTYRINKADDQFFRSKWEWQILELKRQASYRSKQKEGSWGGKNESPEWEFLSYIYWFLR